MHASFAIAPASGEATEGLFLQLLLLSLVAIPADTDACLWLKCHHCTQLSREQQESRSELL